MTRKELYQTVVLLRDMAKLHQSNEEILTDIKAESFVFVMESVLSALSVPEREKGEWIWIKDYCKCSECGIGMGHTEYDFCPNCGADMRGGKE